MKYYYKLFIPLFYVLFCGAIVGAMAVKVIEVISKDWAAALLIAFFMTLFLLMAFFYGKMMWMRVAKIPAVEITEKELIIRHPMKKMQVIPLKNIKTLPHEIGSGFGRNLTVTYYDKDKADTDARTKRKNIPIGFIKFPGNGLCDLYQGIISQMETPT